MGATRKPRSKFEKWVLFFGGTKKLALHLEVTQTAVQHWCARRNTPRARHCDEILSLASGELDLQDILNGTSAK